VDRNDWIQLGEIDEGERLQATDGIATVASIAIVSTNVPVYNIEVHGEHVYQVGDLGVLVHNECISPGTPAWVAAVDAIRNASKGVKPNFEVRTATQAKQLLVEALGNMNRYKNYTHDAMHYAKGFEVHNVMNARELAVHSLQHIKWFSNKTSGHIFYLFPN
jgi:hypothetical protein